MSDTGNLKFCSNCRNIMDAVSMNNQLKWKCSIECLALLEDGDKDHEEESEEEEEKEEEEKKEEGLIILSQTTDDGVNIQLNPINDFTIYDPTLLRCNKVCPHKDELSHEANPNAKSEMIIFKQNIATSDSYFICTVCGKKIKEDLTCDASGIS